MGSSVGEMNPRSCLMYCKISLCSFKSTGS